MVEGVAVLFLGSVYLPGHLTQHSTEGLSHPHARRPHQRRRASLQPASRGAGGKQWSQGCEMGPGAGHRKAAALQTEDQALGPGAER